jgi:hypothetical protein
VADDLFEETPEIVLQCQGLHRYLGQEENRVHVLNDVSLGLWQKHPALPAGAPRPARQRHDPDRRT